MITIYGLTDEHGGIRYVGQTQNPQQRFEAHRHGLDFVTGMAILECVETRELAHEAEHKWINFFGHEKLVNRNGFLESISCEDQVNYTASQVNISRQLYEGVKLSARPAHALAAASSIDPTLLSHVLSGRRKVRLNDPRFIRLGRLVGLKKAEVFEPLNEEASSSQ